jgi:ABC-type uncharacterized transport system permease subunit
MQFALWNTLFASNAGRNLALDHEETIRYIIVATVLSTVMECNIIQWINTEIQTGNIANQLIRPMDFRTMIFSKHLGTTLIKTVLYCIPLCIVTGVAFHKPIVCDGQLGFGFVSIVFAFMIQFLYSLIIGLMAFWLIVTWPLNMLLAAIYKLLSGSWIPVAMFPDLLGKINKFLPFRAIYSIPVTIITSPMRQESIIRNLIVQILWIVILYIVMVVTWKVGKKKLIVQGG